MDRSGNSLGLAPIPYHCSRISEEDNRKPHVLLEHNTMTRLGYLLRVTVHFFEFEYLSCATFCRLQILFFNFSNTNRQAAILASCCLLCLHRTFENRKSDSQLLSPRKYSSFSSTLVCSIPRSQSPSTSSLRVVRLCFAQDRSTCLSGDN